MNDHRRGTSRATEETVEDLDFAGTKFTGLMWGYGRAAHPNNIHGHGLQVIRNDARGQFVKSAMIMTLGVL